MLVIKYKFQLIETRRCNFYRDCAKILHNIWSWQFNQ